MGQVLPIAHQKYMVVHVLALNLTVADVGFDFDLGTIYASHPLSPPFQSVSIIKASHKLKGLFINDNCGILFYIYGFISNDLKKRHVVIF